MTLPFVVGVAGHRQVPDPAPVLEDVRAFLQSVARAAPESAGAGALVLASSLAEGADRLVAHAALELGWRLVVVLPFPQARFEADFPDSVDEFRALLQRADQVTVADATLVPDQDLHLEGAAPDDVGYERAAVYTAQHAHVLLALWDGVPYAGARGGTAHSVALRHAEVPSCSLRLSDECRGPVYHVHVPRQSGQTRHAARWTAQDRAGPSLPPAVKQLLDATERFNAEAACSRQKRPDQWRRAAAQLHLDGASEARLVATFAAASLQSDTSKSSFDRRLLLSVVLLSIGGVLKEAWNYFSFPREGMASYLVGLLLAVLLLGVFRDKSPEHAQVSTRDRHIEMRVLAEMLRIGAALRMTGSAQVPTRLVPSYLWDTSGWIPEAVAALWLTLPPAVPATDYARQTWMRGQVHDYLDPTLSDVMRKQRKLQMWPRLAFIVAVLAATAMFVVTLGSPSRLQAPILSFLTAVNAICLLVVGASGFYAQKKGLDEDNARYRGLRRLYQQGMDRWDRLPATPAASPDTPVPHCAHRAALVCELAGEAGTELLTWMHTTRLKPLELWR